MAKGSSGLAAPVWNARRSPVNTGAPWPVPKEAEARVLGIQRKLHKWASDDPNRRFSDLHNLVCDPATLMMAWLRVRSNRGSRSAGVDGQTARHVEQQVGVEKFLDGLREELRSGSFRPLPVKERLIPKRGGKLRRLGVPALRDRVVQAALKTVLEPIFEADFKPCSYGFRPGRRAHDAIAEIHMLATNSYEWVLEADIKACFDEISHVAIQDRLRARVADKRVMALIKAFLKAGILTELGGQEETLSGTPQGGILTAPTQKVTWVIGPGGGGDRVTDGDRVVVSADQYFAHDEPEDALLFVEVELVETVGETAEEAFEGVGELEVGLGVVQFGVERVELGAERGLAFAQRGHPGAQFVEREQLFLVGLDQAGDRRSRRG